MNILLQVILTILLVTNICFLIIFPMEYGLDFKKAPLFLFIICFPAILLLSIGYLIYKIIEFPLVKTGANGVIKSFVGVIKTPIGDLVKFTIKIERK